MDVDRLAREQLLAGEESGERGVAVAHGAVGRERVRVLGDADIGVEERQQVVGRRAEVRDDLEVAANDGGGVGHGGGAGGEWPGGSRPLHCIWVDGVQPRSPFIAVASQGTTSRSRVGHAVCLRAGVPPAGTGMDGRDPRQGYPQYGTHLWEAMLSFVDWPYPDLPAP